MRKFKVVVNGREYDVEVVEVSEVAAPAPVTAEPPAGAGAPGPALPVTGGAGGTAPASTAAAKPGEPCGEAARKVEAPLAGTILSVRVNEGDRVKVGDVLVTLEALKLENEIASPYSGVVRSVNVSAGESVQAGALLVTVEESAS
ncbi:MAG: biotin/lipoyl-binding protein [Bacillota bacterium]|nr:biotin/lipoyl-binding protein [Bacillota bacterium]